MTIKPIKVVPLQIEHTSQRPRLRQAGLLLIICSVLTIVFLGGMLNGRIQHNRAVEERDALKEQIVKLTRQVSELRLSLASHQIGTDMTRQALEKIRQDNKALLKEIAELNETVSFYKSIMAPGHGKGLQLESIALYSLQGVRKYQLNLVLTQAANKRSYIRGTINATLKGSLNKIETELQLHTLSPDITNPVKFNFKYFQVIEGAFSLPTGFHPEQISITLRTSGKKSKTINRQFSWIELMSTAHKVITEEPENENPS